MEAIYIYILKFEISSILEKEENCLIQVRRTESYEKIKPSTIRYKFISMFSKETIYHKT